jgi:hypothetical protein
MIQKTYLFPLTFEQILNLVLQLPPQEQEEIIQQIKINLPKKKENLPTLPLRQIKIFNPKSKYPLENPPPNATTLTTQNPIKLH